MTRILAAADIGSNTAHLLIAATDGEIVMRVDNTSEWLGLGQIVAKQGKIPKDEISSLVSAVAGFRQSAIAHNAEGLYVFATEAMRAAKNHEDVLKTLKKQVGVDVEIVPPYREAELSLRGVQLDSSGQNLLLEVGGGSAQVATFKGQALIEKTSIAIGTGRVIAESGVTSPCPKDCIDRANAFIEAELNRAVLPTFGTEAVASGGVIRGLWRALHPDGDKVLLLEEVEYLCKAATKLPVDRLSTRFGVKTRRAQTLLPGSLVYLALMRRFGLESVSVSEFGVREGAILEMASGGIGPCPV